jgi:hypothetical protein
MAYALNREGINLFEPASFYPKNILMQFQAAFPQLKKK